MNRYYIRKIKAREAVMLAIAELKGDASAKEIMDKMSQQQYIREMSVTGVKMALKKLMDEGMLDGKKKGTGGAWHYEFRRKESGNTKEMNDDGIEELNSAIRELNDTMKEVISTWK